jgi:small subunit ribosomal protein S1
VPKPSDTFTKGDKILVKVPPSIVTRSGVAGPQAAHGDPGTDRRQVSVGTVLEGKVVSIVDYGAFVELEPGVEGLIHVSEMFWTREIRHPSKVLSVGQLLKVMILEVNAESKRISLGLKQTTANPWLALKEKYAEGTVIRGRIRNITDFGIFVGVEEGIDGLVHVSDISWKHRVKHPSELYKKSQEIEAVVLNVDVENEKFSLGIKQLEKNPWEEFCDRYNPGAVITGKVTNITDFGIFVEIEEGIEGLVHISELSQKRVKAASDLFAVGDAVTAVVKSVDPKNRKIRLSIKDHETTVHQSSPARQYLNNKENLGSSLGKALADIKIDA